MNPNPFRRRRAYRFLVWAFGTDPDRVEIHLVYCEGEDDTGRPCGADSGECSDEDVARAWPFEHAKRFPEHRSYGQLSYYPKIMAPTEEPA
ncbi:hypothetical protein [Kitasatospora sp. NPDC001527]|uniref:DUF7848 domain-containing protein n=1 Tax=Kitasatospora sp. NPDC001527 TaxID=3154519 RepID=UPI0033336A35